MRVRIPSALQWVADEMTSDLCRIGGGEDLQQKAEHADVQDAGILVRLRPAFSRVRFPSSALCGDIVISRMGTHCPIGPGSSPGLHTNAPVADVGIRNGFKRRFSRVRVSPGVQMALCRNWYTGRTQNPLANML